MKMLLIATEGKVHERSSKRVTESSRKFDRYTYVSTTELNDSATFTLVFQELKVVKVISTYTAS